MDSQDVVVAEGPFTPQQQRRHLNETVAAYLLLAPMIVLFCVSVIYPFLETLRLSFYDASGLAAPKWAGLGNYIKLFTDPGFINSLKVTLLWTLMTVTLSVGVGFAIALGCSQAPKLTQPFRIMFFATYAIAEAVSAFIWVQILKSGDAGLLNAVLGLAGMDEAKSAWLGNENTALVGVILAYAWTQVGLPLMLCFAAIQSIPKSLKEAAYIDGAGRFATMRYITMPLAMPGLRVALFINALGALRAFDMIFVLTGGGPVRSTETIGFFMYRESVMQFKLGYGAASTVILLLGVLLLAAPAVISRTRGVK